MKVQINPELMTEDDYDDFIPGKDYTVLSIEGNRYRLLPEDERPSLFPITKFLVTDSTIDPDWLVEPSIYQEEGKSFIYARPKEFSRSGFFIDYFDLRVGANLRIRRSSSSPLQTRARSWMSGSIIVC